MFRNFILFCMISFTLLYRSTMRIVFPNMQAALDHIKEHKGREVLIVDSHDGSKYDSGKWPYTQFNCIINRKPSKDVKSTRKDPNSCDMKFFVRRALRRSSSDDKHYIIQGNLFHAQNCNPEKIKRVPESDRMQSDIFIQEEESIKDSNKNQPTVAINQQPNCATFSRTARKRKISELEYYTCNLCPEIFEEKQGLNLHMRSCKIGMNVERANKKPRPNLPNVTRVIKNLQPIVPNMARETKIPLPIVSSNATNPIFQLVDTASHSSNKDFDLDISMIRPNPHKQTMMIIENILNSDVNNDNSKLEKINEEAENTSINLEKFFKQKSLESLKQHVDHMHQNHLLPNYQAKTCQGKLEMEQKSKKVETDNEKHERFLREKERTKSILASAMAKLRANKIKSEQSSITNMTEILKREKFTCEICDEKFPFDSLLEVHQRIKHKDRNYKVVTGAKFSLEYENNILRNQKLKEEIIDSKYSVMKINSPILKDEIHAETFLEMDIEIKEEKIDQPYQNSPKY